MITQQTALCSNGHLGAALTFKRRIMAVLVIIHNVTCMSVCVYMYMNMYVCIDR